MLMVNQLIGFGVAGAGIGGNDSFTKLLLHGDGADASTTITDSSATGHTVTVSGGLQLDTAQSKFGGASILFGTSSGYGTVANSSEHNFGTGDFTIDFWLRFSSVATAGLIGKMGAGGTDGWAFRYVNGSGLRFLTDSGAATTKAWTPSADTWYHVAFVRTGSTLRFFVDGTQVGTDGSDSETLDSANTLYLGNSSFASEILVGWMDEVRISKGTARWTTTFTPPAEAYS